MKALYTYPLDLTTASGFATESKFCTNNFKNFGWCLVIVYYRYSFKFKNHILLYKVIQIVELMTMTTKQTKARNIIPARCMKPLHCTHLLFQEVTLWDPSVLVQVGQQCPQHLLRQGGFFLVWTGEASPHTTWHLQDISLSSLES